MRHTIVYTSDVHGNEIQYSKLVDFSLRTGADSVIIGGDIAPKGFRCKENYISKQREFLEEKLPELLNPLRKAKIPLYILMGNDDCASNMEVLQKGDPEFYKIIHAKRVQLAQNLEIIGYSFVPITPFGIKDWEKFDLTKVPEALAERYAKRKNSNYNLQGYKSKKLNFEEFTFTSTDETDSIQKDLSEKIYSENAEKTIYVIHTPPDNTNLDQIAFHQHVGSFAIRQFIEQHQPHITLHGHIHETVQVSGEFRERIGKTHSFASGNHNIGPELAIVIFDAHQPESAKRFII